MPKYLESENKCSLSNGDAKKIENDEWEIIQSLFRFGFILVSYNKYRTKSIMIIRINADKIIYNPDHPFNQRSFPINVDSNFIFKRLLNVITIMFD